MKYDRATKTTRPSMSQWNGFLAHHKDYYNGGSTNEGVPRTLEHSQIAMAVLSDTSSAKIPAYTPVRLDRLIKFGQANENPAFEVSAVSTGDTEKTGNYGFTLGEGCGSDGGRVVYGGHAIAMMTRDQAYDGSGLGVSYLGKYDAMWYNVPDGSVGVDTSVLIGPMGNFKVLSFYEPTKLTKPAQFATNKVFVLIDLGSKAGTIEVNLLSSLAAATTTSGSRVMQRGTAKPSSSKDVVTASELSIGTVDTFEMYVYNPFNVVVDAGLVTASWSQTHNCFILHANGSAGGGTFGITLERTGGSAGSSTTKTSWTYSVRALGSSTILQAQLNPETSPHMWRRPALGKLIAATGGLATYDENSDLVVTWINEYMDVSTCEGTTSGGTGIPDPI
jgi:hypothetical protein